jgi:hypothetical protein
VGIGQTANCSKCGRIATLVYDEEDDCYICFFCKMEKIEATKDKEE